MIRLAVLLLLAGTPLATAAPAEQRLDGARMADAIVQALQAAGQAGTPVLSPNRGFPPCPSSPRVTPAQGGWQAVRVICDGPQGWSRTVRIGGGSGTAYTPGALPARAEVAALVLTDSLAQGTVLTEQDLKRTTVPAAGQSDLVTDLSNVVGRRLKTNLGAGQPLLARHLDHDWIVAQDAPVTIVNDLGGIHVETSGIALEPGQLGQAIRVRNPRSGRILRVTVTARNKVSVKPNIR